MKQDHIPGNMKIFAGPVKSINKGANPFGFYVSFIPSDMNDIEFHSYLYLQMIKNNVITHKIIISNVNSDVLKVNLDIPSPNSWKHIYI